MNEGIESVTVKQYLHCFCVSYAQHKRTVLVDHLEITKQTVNSNVKKST